MNISQEPQGSNSTDDITTLKISLKEEENAVIIVKMYRGNCDPFLISFCRDGSGILLDSNYDDYQTFEHEQETKVLDEIARIASEIKLSKQDTVDKELESLDRIDIDTIPKAYQHFFNAPIIHDIDLEADDSRSSREDLLISNFVECTNVIFDDMNEKLKNPVGEPAPEEETRYKYGDEKTLTHLVSLVSVVAEKYGYKTEITVISGTVYDQIGDPEASVSCDPRLETLMCDVIEKFSPTGCEDYYKDQNDGRTTSNGLAVSEVIIDGINTHEFPNFYQTAREEIDPRAFLQEQLEHHSINLDGFYEAFPKNTPV